MYTIPNTPHNVYFDTAATRKHCENDFKAIARACKPEPPDKDGKHKKKKKGVIGKISSITEKLDEFGKKLHPSFRRHVSNAWMDDHCSGLWIKPINRNQLPSDLSSLVEDTIKKLDMGVLDWLGALAGSLDDMVELAYELLPDHVVKEIVAKLALKSGIKGAVGVVGSETVIVPILMGLWTAYDLLETAKLLAGLMGDKGKVALEAFNKIFNIEKDVENLLNNFASSPGQAFTNLMTALALLDPCIRARKCLLVPFNKQNDLGGDGCCPGQTGHHVIPGSAASTGCQPYNHDAAPVICLEGTSNNAGWGSHGAAHTTLKTEIENYRIKRKSLGLPDTISYDDMAKLSIKAVRNSGAAFACDPNCLMAQLDAFYKCSSDMMPKDGTGAMKKPENLPSSDDTDMAP